MTSVGIDVVLEKLVRNLLKEINKGVSLLNFRSDFEWLIKKLTNIRDYLSDADAQSAHDANVKRWLLDVAEIVWDAEDILDECAVESKGTYNKISQSSCVCAFSYSQLVSRFKMASRIKDVKERMRSIMKYGIELKLVGEVTRSDQPSTNTSVDARWRGSTVMEAASNVEDVLRLLDNPDAPVIAVVGMGGVGKTFLLQNAFDRAKGNFERSIWLAISQTYSLDKLQAALASKIGVNEVLTGRIDEVHAAQLIHERLTSTEGRTLIVLDDVWRAAGEDNLISALGLPIGNNSQCKIVVTTRSRQVSSTMDACVYELHPLSGEQSWNLFCAFAFQGNQPPHHLEGVARQIERECGRVPLTVKTVAASLANKTLSREWTSKLEQLRAMSYTEDPIMQILKSSYDSLPPHLKPCFVYLSFFIGNEEIDSQYLINLWVAEGYVPQGENQLDIGWSYLSRLENLCLIERVGDMYDQDCRRFKLHDLLLDLAIFIAKESQCAFSMEEAFRKGISVEKSRTYRRFLMGKRNIGDDDVNGMARNMAYSASCIRTISLSANSSIQNIPASMLNGARVLRVLDLSGTSISSLPTCAGNLKLLRVLNLRGTKITEVPECVKGNSSLRFLDISHCWRLERFPEWIGELNCLEHLDLCSMTDSRFGGLMPKGISKLVSLRVLRSDAARLSIIENEFLKLEHFVKLVNLEEVLIDIHHEAQLESIEDGILATLIWMRNLKLRNMIAGYADVCNLPPLSEEMFDMPYLEVLSLYLFAVPNWICGFSNLKQLQLWNCHCAEYPALETMPNLIKLELHGNGICKALPKEFGRTGAFPQLRIFIINHFSVLEELPELEYGAMVRLEILLVDDCPNMRKVPCGLELLKCLKECYFRHTGLTHMFEKGKELWNKMKASNPYININC